MGKTIGAILTIAAAVAVNFIPGVGTVISGTILSALGLPVTFGAISAITTAITAAGLASLSNVLGLGPKIPKPAQTETSIKSPSPDRVSAYGRARQRVAFG